MSSIGRRAFARTLLVAAGLVLTAACSDLPTENKVSPEKSRATLSFSPTSYYVIRNVATNKVMDVESAGCCNGYFIHQWTYSGQQNAQWRIVDLNNGYYKIEARHSGRVADVRNASLLDGTRIHQWGYNGATNQQFTFTFDGTAYVIEARHSGKALTVTGSNINADGNGIRQYTYTGANTQRWYVQLVP